LRSRTVLVAPELLSISVVGKVPGRRVRVHRAHGEKLWLVLGSRTDLLRESVGNGFLHVHMPVPP
jgi:hypothetical protein